MSLHEAQTEACLETIMRGQNAAVYPLAIQRAARQLIAEVNRERPDPLRLATVDGERIGELRATLRTSCRP